jgi:putative ABC transport system substrate-binding protein
MRWNSLPAIFVLAALASPLGLEAQQPGATHRIGVLSPGSPSLTMGREAFTQRLHELGWTLGQNVQLEVRYAHGDLDRLPDLAADLTRLRVSLIIAFGTPASLAAKQATATIPIVIMAGDPVGSGLVTSLARPGGNITGLTPDASVDLTQAGIKRLELLKEAAPTIVRVAVLGNLSSPPARRVREAITGPAQTLGLTIIPVDVHRPGDLNDALTSLNRERADGLILIEDPPIIEQRQLIIDFATRHRLPTVFGGRVFVDAGGLMSYGTDWTDLLRRSATLIDKILRGARPGDLPIEQPTKFELVINLKTAKALGLTIPPSLLLRADQVID